MRLLSRLLAAAAVMLVAGLGFAADQTILGRTLIVKDAKPGINLTGRKISAKGKEKNSSNTLVGDPTLLGDAGGAILELIANGANSSNQIFGLPQGTSSTGDPFWSGDTTKGFKYKDAKGEQSAVRSVKIKRSASGTFSTKIIVNGKGGSVDVTPPNPGTDGCLALKLGQAPDAGDRYSLRFGPESEIENDGAELFRAKNPTVEGVCPGFIPCGDVAFPTCGDTCAGGGVCAAVQGGDGGEQCGCFAQGDTCGGSCSFQCTSPPDCYVQFPSCASQVAGACPSGTICMVAIANISSCPGGFCVLVVAQCTP